MKNTDFENEMLKSLNDAANEAVKSAESAIKAMKAAGKAYKEELGKAKESEDPEPEEDMETEDNDVAESGSENDPDITQEKVDAAFEKVRKAEADFKEAFKKLCSDCDIEGKLEAGTESLKNIFANEEEPEEKLPHIQGVTEGSLKYTDKNSVEHLLLYDAKEEKWTDRTYVHLSVSEGELALLRFILADAKDTGAGGEFEDAAIARWLSEIDG